MAENVIQKSYYIMVYKISKGMKMEKKKVVLYTVIFFRGVNLKKLNERTLYMVDWSNWKNCKISTCKNVFFVFIFVDEDLSRVTSMNWFIHSYTTQKKTGTYSRCLCAQTDTWFFLEISGGKMDLNMVGATRPCKRCLCTLSCVNVQ